MKKTILINQMSADSIDVLDSIKIEVWYNEGKEIFTTTWNATPEPNQDAEITSIEYEGVEVSELIGTMFSDEELLNAQSEVETEESLLPIKLIAV
jgi:hypothetical protein